ncbi:hypothetical protein [Nonomuraea roseoviolacea]|uniref:RNHCP domain-containing protein n=1 Tax=Nonomuraea roseoviolacea subsp. carminata TaxID=160689 RepID=A0ABT1K9N0_9ACTN|nr:hypothetical protein [Nonomuraea roseoviolacea]MCP2350650.1 hypothetical protein [Nonomuraea roseoviolacea subsp. carminata]
MNRPAALLEQPTLWDEPAPEPQPENTTKRRNRRHVLDLPRPWAGRIPCAALCLICGRPDTMGVCPDGCATVCGRPQPARRDGKAPVEVCLITVVAIARIVPGRQWAIVTCPHCERIHWHQPATGRRYRIGQCGQPYILHIPEVTS